MHILHLTDGIYPITLGGMQRYAAEVTRALLEEDETVKITLVFCDYSHQYAKDDQSKITKFMGEVTKGRLSLIFVPFPQMKFPVPLHYILESKRWSRQLFYEIEDWESYDVIYTQGFSGWQKPKHVKTPMVTNFHGLNMFQKVFGTKEKWVAAVLRKVVKQTIQKSDAVISLGGGLTKILESQNPNNIVEIPVGISKNWQRKTPKERNKTPHFLFVGRPDPIKGLDLFEQTANHFSDAQFVVVGCQGKDTTNLTFKGAIYDESALMEIYDACDFYISCGYSEGMPIAILEAFSRGLPVIASNVGATSELVDENTGWLFDSGNLASLQKALMEANKRRDYATISDNCIEKSKLFSWSNIAIQHLELFKQINQSNKKH